MLAIGALVIAVGMVVLGLDLEGLNTLWFLFAWVGWLLVLDGLIGVAGGERFTRGRRRELGAMLVWSVPFWCIYEGYNLVIDNWTYVFLPRSEYWQALYAAAAFATVLPACFFHADLAGRLLGQTQVRPLRVQGVVEWAVGGFGLLCVVLPFVFPEQCFWMVWGALLGLPAVINRRLGAPSLLADLEKGDPTRLLALLAGGAVAGGFWEGMNYWARTKWVYTVPGFEEWKLFEMPLLGFVGFPFLALSAFEAYSLWCWLARGGRHWEHPDAAQPRVHRRHEVLAMAGLLAFSVAAERWPLDPAVLSVRPLLSEIDGIDTSEAARLAKQGIRSPEQLVRFGVGAPPEARLHAEMSLHKGMGAPHARLVIDELGGFTQLGAADPEALHQRLAERARRAGVRVPTRAQVAVWVRAVSTGAGRR